MNYIKNTNLSFFLFGTLLLCSCGAPGGNNASPTSQPSEIAKLRIQEGMPSDLLEVLEKRTEQFNAIEDKDTLQPETIVSKSRTWAPGKKITVAFKGGTPQLRKMISDAVKPWEAAANITFDFNAPQTNEYREWTVTDKAYKGDIRISFDNSPDGGYWSAIGKDSVNSITRRPNIASMNFQGFTEELPDDWQATVLHEFGHALGFQHEHQNPKGSCEQEYRWNDDNGYVPTVDQYHQFVPDSVGRRPGIYTTLGGAPNYWSRSKVDFNLKEFANSTDWLLTPFDSESIMKYYFGPWMYRDLAISSQSGCYGPPAQTLSAEDQRAAALVYPRDHASIKSVLKQQQTSIQNLLKSKNVPSEVKEQLKTSLKVK